MKPLLAFIFAVQCAFAIAAPADPFLPYTATVTPGISEFHVSHDGAMAFCATGLAAGQPAGVYKFTGTCIPAIEPPGTTPPGSIVVAGVTLPLLRTANISYGATNQAQRRNVALTEYMNVFSVNSATGPLNPALAFPGIGSQPVLRGIPKLFYIALHFKTPCIPSTTVTCAPPLTAAQPWTSQWTYPEYVRVNNYAPLLTVAISKFPGDFSVALPTPGCIHGGVAASAANLLLAKSTTNAPTGWCNLAPNTDYWFNVMPSVPLATPTATTQIGFSRTN